MVWGWISGCYCADLVIQSNVIGVHYRDQILASHMQPFMTAHVEIMLKCFKKTMLSLTQPESVLHTAGIQVFHWVAKSL